MSIPKYKDGEMQFPNLRKFFDSQKEPTLPEATLTPKEKAAELKITKWKLRDMRQKGLLPSVRSNDPQKAYHYFPE